MKNRYDALVIGGGPGGAVAAGDLADRGHSVLLVEKRPAIGAPVRCAEGIGKDVLAEFIEPDSRWISAEINGAQIVAPDGFTMSVEREMAGSKVGYILDRKIFDRELVWQAASKGAEVHVKTRATAPILEDGVVKGATLESCGEVRDVRADVVIAADGVESKFSRWCGVDTAVPLRELMSCAQYLLTDIEIDPAIDGLLPGELGRPRGICLGLPQGETDGKRRDWHLLPEVPGREPGPRLPGPLRRRAFPRREDHRVYRGGRLGLPAALLHGRRRAHDHRRCGPVERPDHRRRYLQCHAHGEARGRRRIDLHLGGGLQRDSPPSL